MTATARVAALAASRGASGLDAARTRKEFMKWPATPPARAERTKARSANAGTARPPGSAVGNSSRGKAAKPDRVSARSDRTLSGIL